MPYPNRTVALPTAMLGRFPLPSMPVIEGGKKTEKLPGLLSPYLNPFCRRCYSEASSDLRPQAEGREPKRTLTAELAGFSAAWRGSKETFRYKPGGFFPR